MTHEEYTEFPSLTGIMVLNRICPEKLPLRWIQFPSPFGTMVLNKYRFMTSTICRTSFRPLSGLWFLTAPFTDGIITPSKIGFAGRILFLPFFRVLS